MNQIGYQMMVLKNNGSSDEEWNKMFSEYKELEAQVQSLGAVKLTNEEKRKYVEMSYEYTQKQMSNAVILDFDPGDHYNDLTGNIDLYVINVTSYTPYGTYNVARVYTLIPPGATASVLSTTKSYTFYNSPNEGVIFGNKIMKAFVGTVWNITSFYIPDGVDVLLSVIFDQMNWPNGKPDISYGGAANVMVTSVSMVVHYWVEIDGKYRFSLATNRATFTESWLFHSITGKSGYKTSEYYFMSDYFDSFGYAVDLARAGRTASHSIPAQSIYHVKDNGSRTLAFSIKPYHAEYPFLLGL